MDRFTAQLIAFNNFFEKCNQEVLYVNAYDVKHDSDEGIWEINYIVHYINDWDNLTDVIKDSEEVNSLIYLEQNTAAITLV